MTNDDAAFENVKWSRELRRTHCYKGEKMSLEEYQRRYNILFHQEIKHKRKPRIPKGVSIKDYVGRARSLNSMDPFSGKTKLQHSPGHTTTLVDWAGTKYVVIQPISPKAGWSTTVYRVNLADDTMELVKGGTGERKRFNRWWESFSAMHFILDLAKE